MKRILIILAGLTTIVSAADIEAGKEKSIVCSSCHGKKGISIMPTYPNLAGQKAQYLIQQMKAYKDGSRKNATMKLLMTPLNNDDMINIATYYESLPADGKECISSKNVTPTL